MVRPRLARTAVPPRGSSGHSQPRAPGSGSGADRAPAGWHHRAGRRAADHGQAAADPAVAAEVVDPCPARWSQQSSTQTRSRGPASRGSVYLADLASQHCRPAAAPARACWNWAAPGRPACSSGGGAARPADGTLLR